MAHDSYYQYAYDTPNKRFLVTVKGRFNPKKIRATFLRLIIDYPNALEGVNIIWLCKDFSIPNTYSFADILEHSNAVVGISPPGKTAIVIEKNVSLQLETSTHYQNLAKLATKRNFKIFDNLQNAEEWLGE